MLALGINEGINSSVVVLEDGKITFALQEERVNRQKEYVGFPHQALEFTLRHRGITPVDVEAVCLSNLESPTFSKEEFRANYDRNAEQTVEELLAKPTRWQQLMKTRLTPERPKPAQVDTRMATALAQHGLAERPLLRTHHHLNHAASAYYGLRKNDQEPHLVLSLDGGGDGDCAHVYRACGDKMELLAATPAGNSVGNLYSRVTHFMGMTPHEHEYKLMGLAAYAKPDYCRDLIERFRTYLEVDGMQFRCKLPVSTFRCAPFLARDFQRVRFDNLAGAMQFFTEELLVEWVGGLVKSTGIGNLVCAGGVFMNVKANQRLASLPGIKFFDVFPSCGDETLPFGALWHWYASQGHRPVGLTSMCLGPDPSYDLEAALAKHAAEIVVEELVDPEARAVELMTAGHVVARCRGAMEFGARALGNRSLTADPSDYSIIPRINKMIKQRDFWMPFAPAVLREDAREFLQVPDSLPERLSPFMMHTFDSTSRREDFAAGVHAYDQTARAQVVHPENNAGFYDLISRFKAVRGKGVVLNTSFNLHGLPIVMGSFDALEVLLKSDLTHLILHDRLVTKR